MAHSPAPDSQSVSLEDPVRILLVGDSVRIAAAVADSLHLLGIGPAVERPLPTPPVGPRRGADLSVRAGDGAAELRWTGPPGATAQYVWLRDRTLGDPWLRLPFQVTGSSWSTGGLQNGHHYSFRLQPVKGDDEPEGQVFSDVETRTELPLAVVRGLPVTRSWRFEATATRDGLTTLSALVRVRRDRSAGDCG